VHAREHRHLQIGVVVDEHLRLGIVEPVETAGVLGERSPPGKQLADLVQATSAWVDVLGEVLGTPNHTPSAEGGKSGEDQTSLRSAANRRGATADISDGVPRGGAETPRHHDLRLPP
jgi:hypothetical protein